MTENTINTDNIENTINTINTDNIDYCCYIIENGRSTYVGITNNRVKRLRQHNSEISGGAKYTSSRGPGWKYVCVITNLDKITSMQLEWAIKHEHPVNASGITNRIRKMASVLNKEKFTKKSPETATLELRIEWHGTHMVNENTVCLSILEKLNKDNITITMINDMLND